MVSLGTPWSWRNIVVAAVLVNSVVADNILGTAGFFKCGGNNDIVVQRLDISYNNDNQTIIYDVLGSSLKEQNVTAVLEVKAYGNTIFNETFSPCSDATFVAQLCPVPEGTFGAKGRQQIPREFADFVPEIAFKFPDIAAFATLKLIGDDGDSEVACIQSQVSNGQTANVPAVPYVAAGIAGAALVASGISALGSAMAGGSSALGGSSSAGGTGSTSPSFTETMTWFQGLAMNGMMSVNYPPIYRSFTKNFAFSIGIIPIEGVLRGIDDFRAKTGGNLTEDSVDFLSNATLVFPDGSLTEPDQMLVKAKRALNAFAQLTRRQFVESDEQVEDASGFQRAVSGIQAYVEQLRVPKSDVFMSVLLVVAIVIAAIALGILLVKVILEGWALFGNFPKSLAGFRKHYWGSIARAITTLILLLYGIWVLYCIFQFTQGDSIAAKVLAGVTLALFTGVLAFFSWKIWHTARKLKQADGDADGLYDEKEIWVKYSLFYESYKRGYWWLFIPAIAYMFAKGATLAALDGRGMAQTIALLIVEAIMLVLLLWSRPYERRSGNILNICIQVVRVLSIACILIFVEEFGISQTPQTITGLALIIVQSVLTGIMVILIAWNAINACCKANPHRKRRKELEQLQRDNLTPLDARNSLLIERQRDEKFDVPQVATFEIPHQRSQSKDSVFSTASKDGYQPQDNGRQGLMSDAAPMGMSRQPTGISRQGTGFSNAGIMRQPTGASMQSYGPASQPPLKSILRQDTGYSTQPPQQGGMMRQDTGFSTRSNVPPQPRGIMRQGTGYSMQSNAPPPFRQPTLPDVGFAPYRPPGGNQY